jgi:hypothetical protein
MRVVLAAGQPLVPAGCAPVPRQADDLALSKPSTRISTYAAYSE